MLRDTGTGNHRHALVYSFSGGRTENSSDLSDLEIHELIRHLEQMPKPGTPETRSGVDYRGQQMRRRILSMCYLIGWTRLDEKKGRHVVDFERLNAWLLKTGYEHKPLNDYTYNELQKLVVQFERMTKEVLR